MITIMISLTVLLSETHASTILAQFYLIDAFIMFKVPKAIDLRINSLIYSVTRRILVDITLMLSLTVTK